MRIRRLWRFTPRLAPEWGSGGIFGLRFHKGVLCFNLAFEAEAHFVREDETTIYRYELVGPPPVSGGDTYNAVAAVDDDIYFGGWVHAPADFSKEDGVLHFHNKFSHVHKYDVGEDEVSLLWKEGAGDKLEWAGEVSEVLYDDLNHDLLLARADGHRNLGIYRLSLSDNSVSLLSDAPGLHGAVYSDNAAFNTGRMFMDGVQLINLRNHKVEAKKFDLGGTMSRDGGPIIFTWVGSLASAFGNLFAFVRSGIFVGDPLSEHPEDDITFVRLFDFPGYPVSPFRVNSLPVGGGILTAFNGLPDMLGMRRAPVAMPSALVYVSPPTVRVVGALGCRVTSLETCSSKLLVATNTMQNFSEYRTTLLDAGHRDILELTPDLLVSRPPPLDIAVRAKDFDTSHWGGVPLSGYSRADMVVKSTKDNDISVFEYDLSLPPVSEAGKDSFKVRPGKNLIDLTAFRGIVSFRFSEPDPEATVRLYLS